MNLESKGLHVMGNTDRYSLSRTTTEEKETAPSPAER